MDQGDGRVSEWAITLQKAVRSFVEVFDDENLGDDPRVAFDDMKKALVQLEASTAKSAPADDMMNGEHRYVYAIVELKVRLRLNQPWSDSETMGQIRKVAIRDAREKLERELRGRFGIVGEPHVETVIAGER